MRRLLSLFIAVVLLSTCFGCFWEHDRGGYGEREGYGERDRGERGDRDRGGYGEHDRDEHEQGR